MSLLGDNRATDILVNKEGSSSRSRHFELATIFRQVRGDEADRD